MPFTDFDFTPYRNRTYQIESGWNPHAVTGSNRGLGQWGPREEAMYGITDANRTSLPVQDNALYREAQSNWNALGKTLGRDPTPGELYFAHQQGVAGAPALLTGGDQPAWKTVRQYYPSDRVAQLAISGNLPKDSGLDGSATAQQFSQYWINKFEHGASGASTGQHDDVIASLGLHPHTPEGVASSQATGAPPWALMNLAQQVLSIQPTQLKPVRI